MRPQAIPPFLFPHHKRQWNSRLVETLQTSSTLFYVIAMLIILARAHHIDWPPVSDDAHHAVPVHRKEAMGISPWGGISILIFCFSSHQSTFAFQRSLKPPKSLLLPTQQQHRNILSRHIRPQRYNFEMVAFSALLASALVCLGWGLVGYLAIPYPHVGPINIFNSLPHDDTWFAFARLLVLTTMLCGFGSVVRPATTAMRRLLQWPLRFYRQQEEAYQRRIRDAESSDDSDSDLDMHMPAATNKDTTRRNKIKALKRTAVLLAWVIATLLALLFGTNNVTLASMVEVIGCIGSAIQAFIVPGPFSLPCIATELTKTTPAIAFIVLFHIRKARSITGLFASQPQTTEAIADGEAADVDGQVDDMLFKKEQQLQQRLSGRRVWQDIGVFGMLVPAGFVVVFRGLYALIST